MVSYFFFKIIYVNVFCTFTKKKVIEKFSAEIIGIFFLSKTKQPYCNVRCLGARLRLGGSALFLNICFPSYNSVETVKWDHWSCSHLTTDPPWGRPDKLLLLSTKFKEPSQLHFQAATRRFTSLESLSLDLLSTGHKISVLPTSIRLFSFLCHQVCVSRDTITCKFWLQADDPARVLKGENSCVMGLRTRQSTSLLLMSFVESY